MLAGWRVEQLDQVVNRDDHRFEQQPRDNVVRAVDEVDRLAQQCRGQLQVLGHTVPARRCRHDPGARGKLRNPVLVTEPGDDSELEIRTSVEPAKEGPEVRPDPEVGELPSVDGEADCHAAIVAVPAIG